MASAYGQSNVKRQKVREPSRSNDSQVDYFQGIDNVEYNNMSPTTDTCTYRHYNHGERLQGRSMEEWLKFSLSLSTVRFNGSDKQGKPTYQRNWSDNTCSVENYKRHIKACFEFCQKIGVKYWTAFDTDLVPYSDNPEEWKAGMDDVTEFIQENVQRYHVKPLWIAPDLHSHAKFASGAATNSDANIFMQTASQVKRALDMAHKLNAENFLFWPYREGYNTLYNSDIPKEMKLFGRLLKMAADFKERIGFRGQFIIMPCYFEDEIKDDLKMKRYMWDTTSCLFILKHYNLERFYKVCAEPGHQANMAQVYNMLGGLTINNTKYGYDNRTLTLMMKSIVDQGTNLPAGINLSLYPRRDSVDLRDLILSHVKIIDSVAKALRVAATMISDQIFNKHVQQRYVSYYSGLGARLLSGDLTLEECDEYCKKSQNLHTELHSSKSEHWDIVFQRYLDSCDHI